MKITPIAASIFEQFSDDTKQSLRASGIIPVLDPYLPLWERPHDVEFIVIIGGRGAGKTYEVSKFGAYDCVLHNRRVALLRDEKETIQESILNEIFSRFDEMETYQHIEPGQWEKLTRAGIRKHGEAKMAIFTKGFRASAKEKKTNLKGVSELETAIIEEGEDIREFAKFNTFKDSVRPPKGKKRLIIVLLNTPDIKHWIVDRYFDLEQVADGYYRLIPKNIPGFMGIITDCQDNPYLEEKIRQDYLNSGNPASERYDYHYYMTEICGYAAAGRKGQVLTNVKPYSLAEYMALPYREIYGQDWGTASPAGLIGVKIHRNKCWARELNYMPMDILQVGKMYCRRNFSVADEIIYDTAGAKEGKKLKSGWMRNELSEEDLKLYPRLLRGWNMKPARKLKIITGINKMKSMELYAVDSSKNLWNEITNYVWSQDKWGNYVDEPIDNFNHLIDPWRYIIERKCIESAAGSSAA